MIGFPNHSCICSMALRTDSYFYSLLYSIILSPSDSEAPFPRIRQITRLKLSFNALCMESHFIYLLHFVYFPHTFGDDIISLPNQSLWPLCQRIQKSRTCNYHFRTQRWAENEFANFFIINFTCNTAHLRRF